MTGETPEQLRQRATRLLREGRGDEAIDAHRALLAVRPELPDAWFNLGYLLRVALRFDEALDAYGAALAHGVRGPEEVHVNRAAILSEHLARADAAEAELGEALARNPRFVLAWLNLGQLREDRGDAAAAREAYARAAEIAPTNGRALARLAAIDVFEGKAAEAAGRLRPLLSTPQLPADDAVEVAFALANALDAAGRYDEAFAVVAEANRVSRLIAPPGSLYDPGAQERLVDALIAGFPLAARAAPEASGTAPVFICGMFRSGSTLAEQILARHSRVTPGGELEFLPAMVRTQLQPYPQSLASASPQQLAELRDAYLRSLEKVHPGADVVTDKRPDNFLHIGLVKALFPQARIVHTRREPLDTIVSAYFLNFAAGVPYSTSLDDLVHHHRQYERLMAHWKALFPGDIHDFDYDLAVADPRPQIEALLAFCGLDWEAACLADAPTSRAVRTASVWQVRQPVHARSSGRWRNYARQLEGIAGEVKPARS